MANLFQDVIYLQIRRGWLSVMYLGWSGRKGDWSGTPAIVFYEDSKGKIQVYENTEGAPISAVDKFTAFSHPRAFIDDYDKTREALSLFLKKAGQRRSVRKSVFVVQVSDEWEGGLTQVELRALLELCKELGAKKVLPVYATRELSIPETLQLVREHKGGTILTPIPLNLH